MMYSDYGDRKIMDPKVAKLPKWAQGYIEHLQRRADDSEKATDELFGSQRETPVWWEVGRGNTEKMKRYVAGAPTDAEPERWPHGEYIKIHFLDQNGAEWEVGFDSHGDLTVSGYEGNYEYDFRPESRGQMSLVSLNRGETADGLIGALVGVSNSIDPLRHGWDKGGDDPRAWVLDIQKYIRSSVDEYEKRKPEGVSE